MGVHPMARKAVGRLGAAIVLVGVCLFGAAGTFRWWQAWAFVAAYAAAVIFLTTSLFRRSPELLEERIRAHAEARPWERALVTLMAVVLPFASLALAGLDRRLGWTGPIPPVGSVAALAAMVAGTALAYWAMASNPFFSSHVRIQTDRGHVVVSGGPYRIVRHPGYAGAIVSNLATPVVLGSLPALATGLAGVALIVLRTVLEERALHAGLDGYSDYARHVRYRLVPGVW